MKTALYLLILFSVAASSIAQILLKTGMSQSAVRAALDGGSAATIALYVASSFWVVAGLALYALGAVVWLFVLARAEVSYAYPFMGAGFILTLILGKVFMGDTITATRLTGTLLVSAGLVLIARQ